MSRATVAGLMFVSVFALRQASAYDDVVTHPTLTEIALMQSRLANDTSLLPSIDLNALGSNSLGDPSSGISPLSIANLMRLGAVKGF